jgi:hypothetical protein
MAKLEWERVDVGRATTDTQVSGYTIRAKVPGGWLVNILDGGASLTFVPDPKHEWK